MNIERLVASKLKVDITTQELFQWAEESLRNHQGELRDIIYFACITGYEYLIRNLFTTRNIVFILPDSLIAQLKTVDCFQIVVHSPRYTITITNKEFPL